MIGSKPEIRDALRRTRAAYAAQSTACVVPPEALRARLSGTIASYRPIGSEIDPAPIEALVRDQGGQICYPRVEGAGLMRFLLPLAHADWEDGPYGVIQPRGHCAEADPALVIVPLLAFDRRGHRLGQGGGYYDRALARLPDAYRLGIAWSVQEIDEVPVAEWDIPLDAILTEQELILP